jgi:hypothetical protein
MSAQHSDFPSPAPIVPVLTEKDTSAIDVFTEGNLASLRQEVDALRLRQQDDFETLRAEMAAEISALRAAVMANALYARDVATSDAPPGSSEQLTSRRTLLKWGGIGAAAALAAAGGASLTTQTAHALDGANLTLGSSANSAEHLTKLTYDGNEAAPTAFQVSTTVVDSIGVSGKAGDFGNIGSAGIVGTAGTGTSAFGVAGQAGSNGTGAYGVAKGVDAWAVWGDTDAGVGVQAASGTGIDLSAQGSGRVFQFSAPFDGAPTTGTYSKGEQIRDAGGNLLICIVGGTPGTWRKVVAAAAGRGGAVHLLSAPIRLLDTRTNTKFPAGSTNILQVTGVAIGGISVPKGATGVVGNVTVVAPSAGGDLRLYPGGAPAPATSSINFATGQVIANGVAVGLNTSGQISIKVDMPVGAATHVLFDASGYVM